MLQVHVSSKGQVVIPISVRQRLGIKPGSRLELSEAAGEVRLKPVRRMGKAATVEEGIGLAGYHGPPVSDEEMNRAVRDAAADRYLRTLPPLARKALQARMSKRRNG